MAKRANGKRSITRLPTPDASRQALDKGATVKIEGKEYPDYVGIALRYADLIASQKYPACRYLRLGAERFLRQYEAATSGKGPIGLLPVFRTRG